MYVCMYIYIYICMYVCMYMSMCRRGLCPFPIYIYPPKDDRRLTISENLKRY